MSKKIIFYGLIIIVFGTITYILIITISTHQRNIIVEKQRKDLPDITLINTDSTKTALRTWSNKEKVVIFYFHSDCDYCKFEIQEFKKVYDKFGKSKILWISTEHTNKICKIFDDSFLKKSPNIKIAQISQQIATEVFGFKTIPSTYIYDRDGVIIKKYTGSAKMQSILKYIQII